MTAIRINVFNKMMRRELEHTEQMQQTSRSFNPSFINLSLRGARIRKECDFMPILLTCIFLSLQLLDQQAHHC